jgi:hypothetical protein
MKVEYEFDCESQFLASDSPPFSKLYFKGIVSRDGVSTEATDV